MTTTERTDHIEDLKNVLACLHRAARLISIDSLSYDEKEDRELDDLSGQAARLVRDAMAIVEQMRDKVKAITPLPEPEDDDDDSWDPEDERAWDIEDPEPVNPHPRKTGECEVLGDIEVLRELKRQLDEQKNTRA